MKTNQALKRIEGKTIAIVYIFEKENALGYDHFYIWKDEHITAWISAIYELKCIPYIMDLRTFMYKASNNSLPQIDYVLNLNNGCIDLSTMSLVPSICSFLNIPCIPCNSLTMLCCENKEISNCVVKNSKIRVPQDVISNSIGIYRPKSLGNSSGVTIGNNNGNGLYQEFISGYDVTIPFLFNPYSSKLEAMPATIYLPDSLDPNWIYTEKSKIDDKGFKTINYEICNDDIISELKKTLDTLEVNTFARIDARIKVYDNKLNTNIIKEELSLESFYFIEINAMPTIENGDGFDIALQYILESPNNQFYKCAKEYYSNVSKPTINGFVLFNSIVSIITSKY